MTQMHKRMAELIVKQLTGDISEEEIIELDRMRANSKFDPELWAELLDRKHLATQLKFLETFDEETSWKRVEAAYSFKPPKQRFREIVKLAAVFIPLAFLTWLFISPGKPNRYIKFQDSDAQTILKQIETGTDYIVEYSGAIRPRKYTGILFRNITVENFAEFIELETGKQVTVKGNKFIVHL